MTGVIYFALSYTNLEKDSVTTKWQEQWRMEARM